MRAERQPEEAGFRIRPLEPGDEADVRQILLLSPEAANWSSNSVSGASAGPGLGLASDSRGKVTGFLLARCLFEEAEIFNVAVLPDERRHGVGTALLEKALSEFRMRGVARVFLEVRESNASAIAFYRQHGFVETGRRKGYYRAPDEAAVLMAKQLNQREPSKSG